MCALCSQCRFGRLVDVTRVKWSSVAIGLLGVATVLWLLFDRVYPRISVWTFTRIEALLLATTVVFAGLGRRDKGAGWVMVATGVALVLYGGIWVLKLP